MFLEGGYFRFFPARLLVVLAVCASGVPAAGQGLVEAEPVNPDLALLVIAGDYEAIRSRGPEVMPALARIYRAGDAEERARVAGIFYRLGWKSPEAMAALMEDIHTDDRNLRINVQYALGRVSDDRQVVDALVENLLSDSNPLFRDKAACGLASDQIHLSDEQKGYLFARVIPLLGAEDRETRHLAIRILWTHTGQAKGFLAHAPLEVREKGIARWKAWLAEYQAQVPR